MYEVAEYLDEGEFADAGTSLGVSDCDLSIVLDPPSTTQNVVHTCGHFIPLIMVTTAAKSIPINLRLSKTNNNAFKDN